MVTFLDEATGTVRMIVADHFMEYLEDTRCPGSVKHAFSLSFSIRFVSITAMTATLAMVIIPTVTRKSMRTFIIAFPYFILRMVREGIL
jgi:hypothetical protein